MKQPNWSIWSIQDVPSLAFNFLVKFWGIRGSKGVSSEYLRKNHARPSAWNSRSSGVHYQLWLLVVAKGFFLIFSCSTCVPKWYNKHIEIKETRLWKKKYFTTKYTTNGGLLLGFIGGGLMSLPHALPEFGRDPNGEPTSFSSLIGVPVSKIPSCVFHLFYFFSIGFVVALHIKEYRKTAFGGPRCWFLCFVVTSWFPLGVCHTTCREFPLLLFGTGMMMLTFTGSFWLKPTLTILCTFGNYRKILWRPCTESLEERRFERKYRRGRYGTGIVVGFVAGAISVAILMHFIQSMVHLGWITVNLFWSHDLLHRQSQTTRPAKQISIETGPRVRSCFRLIKTSLNFP